MAESIQINIQSETESNENKKRHYSGKKITSLESILIIANFILELPSAVFDQLSSAHKPQFALLSMLMSFTVLITSVIDLVYKARRQRVSLKKKGLLVWFYHPYPNSKPFGTFPDVIGLTFAFFQWIFAAIAYVFVSRNTDNPINFSTLPIIFNFGLLYSKLSGNLVKTRKSSNLRKFHREEEFTLAELAAATNDFSGQRLGQGRFGTVYKGQLQDGREVAIKRKDISEHMNTIKDSVFKLELVYYLRLHHKHLVGLVGYCEEKTERLLVFDYMSNGSLYRQLFQKGESEIDSWAMRIRIALDAARGIDYLHNYAVPPILHRAIKSSCILLDSNWTARVADFGLAWMRLESESEPISNMEAERDGYVDPEFNGENLYSEKSDVYSFGVVLLELLTGKMAVFDNGGMPVNLVEFVVSKIKGNELPLILDRRIGPPESASVAEAIEMMAYTALHCVNSEGINRPNIANIVNHLEQALSFSPFFDQEQLVLREKELTLEQEQIKKVISSNTRKAAKNNSESILSTYEQKCPSGGENAVIIYTTTVRGIRKTFEDCNIVRSIIEAHNVHVIERNVSMDSGLKEELRGLMGSEEVKVPQVFVKGRLIGGAEEVAKLDEEGKMGILFEGIERRTDRGCEGCAGIRFVVCKECNGSCKVMDLGLKKMVECGECNENGLIQCPICC